MRLLSLLLVGMLACAILADGPLDNLPEKERKEVEDIYIEKGFSGEELQMVVNRITSNRAVWLDTMMKDELGMMKETKSPLKCGASTFGAFVLAGAIPLIAFVITLM